MADPGAPSWGADATREACTMRSRLAWHALEQYAPRYRFINKYVQVQHSNIYLYLVMGITFSPKCIDLALTLLYTY